MRKIIFLLVIFLSINCISQIQGEWVWKSGANTINYSGNYGTLGIPAATNSPPGLYEAAEWTDLQGNFWIYGGAGYNNWPGDLWKYEPSTNLWTWVHGPGTINPHTIQGTKGVSSVSNSPGVRSTSYTWTDNNNDLWLFGGINYKGGTSNDLWKYNIPSNTWTWMKGDTLSNSPANYGIKGIEHPNNNPKSSTEIGISWTDNSGDLWLLDSKGCLWKYIINTNNWIWIKGNNPPNNAYPVHGTKGIANINNTPGNSFFQYTRWKDSQNNLWYLQGMEMILWKYNITQNMWTWVNGDTTYAPIINYGNDKCDQDNPSEISPYRRVESRACWIDNCDNLWLMGGFWQNATDPNLQALNDLIYYDTTTNLWIWADNDTILNPTTSYGTLGVSSPANSPASRNGALPFKDQLGNLWLFGGVDNLGFNYYGDLWMYTIDTSCTKCNSLITGNIKQNNFKSISVFPNPSSSFVTIKVDNNELFDVVIIDVFNEKIFESKKNNREIEIDLSNYSKGIYNILIKFKTTQTTRRLILQ